MPIFQLPVPIIGYISGGGGTFPVLGSAQWEITGNTDLVLTKPQADPYWIQITSDGASTAERQVVVPLIKGKVWAFQNATTEGFAINVIGATGTGVLIQPGTTVTVATDGTNVTATGAASAGSSFAGPVLVFDPGYVGTPPANTFTTFGALTTAAAGQDIVSVYVPSSATIPAAPGPVPYAMPTQWYLYLGAAATLTLPTNTTFSSNPIYIGAVGATRAITTIPPSAAFLPKVVATGTTSPFAGANSVVLDGVYCTRTGSAALFNVTSASSIFLRNGAYLSNSSFGFALTGTSGDATIYAQSGSAIDTNALNGAAVHDAIVFTDGTSIVSVSQFLGTITPQSYGPSDIVVFQPGGAAKANIVTTEAATSARATQIFGAVTVQVDLSATSPPYTLAGSIGCNDGAILRGFLADGEFTPPAIDIGLPIGPFSEFRDIQITVQDVSIFSNEPPSVFRFTGRGNCISDPSGGDLEWPGATTVNLEVHDSFQLGEGTYAVIGGFQSATNVDLYDAASLQANAVPLVFNPVITVHSPAVFVDPSYYPFVLIDGVLIDGSGTAFENIPAPSSPGALISDQANGILWQSNGTIWVQISDTVLVPTIVFQPGGTPTSNVFVDETTLAGESKKFNDAPYFILFDLSLSGSTTYAFTSGTLAFGRHAIWTDGGQGYTLVFIATTQAVPPDQIDGTLTIQNSQATSPFTQGGSSSLRISGSASLLNLGGPFAATAPLFTATGLGVFYEVYLEDAASITGNPGGFGAITADTDAVVTVYATGDASIEENAITVTNSGHTSIVANGGGVFVDSSLYPILVVGGLFIDQVGGGLTSISTGTSPNGAILVDGTTGLVYVNFNAWVPIDGATIDASAAGPTPIPTPVVSARADVTTSNVEWTLPVVAGLPDNYSVDTWIAVGPAGIVSDLHPMTVAVDGGSSELMLISGIYAAGPWSSAVAAGGPGTSQGLVVTWVWNLAQNAWMMRF